MQMSRLYGLYIHNLTKGMDNRQIALEAVDRFLDEKPPMKYEYGDVIVLMEDHDKYPDQCIVADMIYEIFERNGFIVDKIHPYQLYRLLDSIVVHYIFVDDFIEQDKSEEYISKWEKDMGLDKSDLRYTRYLKTFFMKT